MRRWIDVVVLLAAWAWIIAQAAHDSLWYDETVNAYLATSSFATIWEWSTQIDNQLPLHFFVLNMWAHFFGSSEFALRLFSYWVALLSVAGMMTLARQLTQRIRAGWLVVLFFMPLGGFNYAATEVRTYGLAMMLLVWTLVMMLRLWRSDQPVTIRGSFAYGLLLLMLAYSHYTAWIVIGVQCLYILWRLYQHRWRDLRAAILSGLPTAMAVIGWLLLLGGRDINSGTAFDGTVSVQIAFETYVSFAIYGQQIFTEAANVRASIFFAFVMLAGLAWWGTSRRAEAGMVLLLAIVPLVSMIFLTNQVAAKLSGRHLWVLWVVMPLLLTGGVVQFNRRGHRRAYTVVSARALAILALLLLAQDIALEEEYRGDLRGAFAILEREAGPNDLLVLRDGTLFTAAEYYDSPIPYIGLPDVQLTDVEHQIEIHEANDTLNNVDFLSKERIWVLSWQADTMDPTALGWGIFDYYSNGNRQWWMWPHPREVSLVSYTLAERELSLFDHIVAKEPVIQVPPDGEILLGFDVYYPPMQDQLCAVIVDTWWWRGERDYLSTLVSVRVADVNGNRLVQQDAPPAGFFYSQDKWTPFVPILGRTELLLSCNDLVRGSTVEMVVYDANGEKPQQPVLLDTIP